MFHVFHVFNSNDHPRVVPWLPAGLQPDCYLPHGTAVIDWVLHWLAWFELNPDRDFLGVSVVSASYEIWTGSEDPDFWETLYKIEKEEL